MDGFSVGDIQLPADFDQQIAAQLAAQGYNFAVQPGATAAPATAAPATTAPNFAVQPSTPINPAFNIDKSGMANEQGMGENPPTFAVQPPKVDETNFTVLGNNPTRKFGQAPDGKYYFEGREITPQDFTVLKQTNDAYLASTSAPNLTVANATGTAAPTNLTVANATGTAAPTDLAVANATGAVPIARGVTLNPQGLTTPEVPTITATPAAPFDYSKLSTGEPQLVAAGASYKNNATGQLVPAGTDHYVAYTNDGGFAGTVMVAPGQKIRMVDATNGDVVFQGTGPEGAKQATALANAMSQDKGRRAAWQIQAENEQGGYTTQASERYDPKKPGLFSQLLPIAVAILGAVLLPGVGAALAPGLFGASGAAALTGGTLLGGATALGAGLGAAAGTTGLGVVRGDPLKDILISSAISGIGAGVVGPAVGKFLSPVAGGISPGAAAATDFGAAVGGSGGLGTATITNAAGNTLGSTVGGAAANVAGGLAGGVDYATGLITNAAGRTLGDNAFSLVVPGVRNVAPTLGTKIASSVGALAPDLISGSGGDTGSLAGGTGAGAGDTVTPTLEEVVITSRNPAELAELAKRGVTFEQMLSRGVPLALASAAILSTGGTVSNNVAANPPPGNVTGLTPTNVTGPPPSLLDAIKAGTLPAWIAANPLLAIQYGLVAAGAVSSLVGGGGGGSGSGGLTVGAPGSPGTRGSLGAEFSTPLDLSKYAVRTPRDMSGVDFSNYGAERSFFNDVPQLPESAYAVRPSATLAPQQATLPTTEARVPSFSTIQYQLAQEKGLPPAPTGKRYIKRDDGEIILVDDSPDATYKGRSGTVKRVRDLSVYQGGSTNKPKTNFAAANTPEVIANLRSVGGLPMKRGGRAQFAVTGSGTGRSDSIPAVLSDGEYVMDAETVALLGDGSSKAGAAKLDQFRVRVRKHKGRDLARGKFSVNAKRPEAYLSGGAS